MSSSTTLPSVRFQCEEGHIWEAKPNNVLNGRGCPECAEHKSDNDIFYIWMAGDQNHVSLHPGEYLVKYGVTSERLGESRIKEVANSWKTIPHILAFVKTKSPATWSEQAADDIGDSLPSDYVGLDGWTEFRIVNDGELAQLMALANKSAEYKIIWNDIVGEIKEFHHKQLPLDL